jgi:integrase
VFYRIDGQQIRDVIGRYPAKKLGEARQAARDKLDLVERGKDPRTEASRLRAQEAQRRAETFAKVADQYHTGHLAKLTSGEELWQRVQDDLLPAWRDLPIRDIRRGAVMTLLDSIERDKGVYARNRRLALIRHMFNYALDRELVDANPAARIPMLEEAKRQRILTDAELVEVWNASDLLDDAFRRFTRELILLGQRRNEVAGMAWPEIEEAKAEWLIAAERMKHRSPHLVPLPASALLLIGSRPQDNPATYVFSTGRRGDAPISGFNKLKLQLDKHILAARRKTDPEAKPMAAWRLHDLRRTFRSGLSRLRIPPHIAERVIAHLPPGIERTYDVHEYVDEKRNAIEAWASYVDQLVNPKPKITPLEQARQKRAKRK